MTMRRASTRLRRRLFRADQHDRDSECGLVSHLAHEPKLTGETPAVWTSRWLAQLRQDLRYAVRAHTRTPVLSVTVIATLALGIGANTAIFSALDAVVLRPLPVRDPGQLVELLSRYPGEPRMASFTQGAFEHFRDHNTVLSDLVAVATAPVHVRTQMGHQRTSSASTPPETTFPRWVCGRRRDACPVRGTIERRSC